MSDNVIKTIGVKTSVEGFHAFAKAVEMFGQDVDFLAVVKVDEDGENFARIRKQNYCSC